jgi:hypothetical protein
LANHQDRQLPLFGREQNKKGGKFKSKNFLGGELAPCRPIHPTRFKTQKILLDCLFIRLGVGSIPKNIRIHFQFRPSSPPPTVSLIHFELDGIRWRKNKEKKRQRPKFLALKSLIPAAD